MKHFFFAVCFFIFIQGKSQSIGSHPSDINWHFIENENVKIIYPKNKKAQAERIANVIEHIKNNNTESVGSKWKKVDLILQTHQVISNGFVTVAPFRSELFGTSPQNFSALGSQNWLDLLAIHEYRHVLQYSNLDRGLTKLLHITNGDFGWGSLINFKVPGWYLEGDAVLSETLLTENGRGRNPYFFKEQRALLLKDIDYSYMKVRNGSFKDILPNRYQFGFSMVNYLRNHFGNTIGSMVLARTGAGIPPFRTISKSFKTFTGINTNELYAASNNELKNRWKKEVDNHPITTSKLISPRKKKAVVHYTFPQLDEKNGIFCIKKSFTSIPEIVYLKNNKENHVTFLGYTSQEFISYKNNKILWTELGVDIRRNNKNFSNVVLYDLKRKRKIRLTQKSKYFSPELSNDGKKIIVVQANENLQNNLTILDSKTGTVIQTIANPFNDFISFPKWNSEDNRIIYLAKRNSKIAFFQYHLKTQTQKQITSWTAHTIGPYQLKNDCLYYSASFNGIDNIYKTEISTPQNTYQLTSVETNAFSPSISLKNEELIFSKFTSKGYELRKTKIQALEKITITEPIDQEFYNISLSEKENPILDKIERKKYSSKKYNGLFKGMKLHSWGIDYYNSSINNQVYFLQMNNLLNDLSANVSLIHNNNENSLESAATISYGKYFLIGNARYSNTGRNFLYINSLNSVSGINFQENKFSLGLSAPLKWLKGNYSRNLNISGNLHFHNNYNFTEAFGKVFNFNSFSSRISFSNYRRMAQQNLAPKFGQFFEFSVNKSFEKNHAENYNFIATIFLPGLSANHSLSFNAYWNKQPAITSYRFSDRFNYARGYKNTFNKEGKTIRTNYKLPLFYPDWGFWNLTYFKRIRATLFYDISELKAFGLNASDELVGINLNQNSYGFEIMFDNTLFNNYSFAFGIRNSFLENTDSFVNTKKQVPEIIFTIGF